MPGTWYQIDTWYVLQALRVTGGSTRYTRSPVRRAGRKVHTIKGAKKRLADDNSFTLPSGKQPGRCMPCVRTYPR